jgi:hypothetical protein
MKFTIRDLFLVTMIVALGFGWWLDRSRLATRAESAERSLQVERFSKTCPSRQHPAKNPPSRDAGFFRGSPL